jgi:hypothetical protein
MIDAAVVSEDMFPPDDYDAARGALSLTAN